MVKIKGKIKVKILNLLSVLGGVTIAPLFQARLSRSFIFMSVLIWVISKFSFHLESSQSSNHLENRNVFRISQYAKSLFGKFILKYLRLSLNLSLLFLTNGFTVMSIATVIGFLLVTSNYSIGNVQRKLEFNNELK